MGLDITVCKITRKPSVEYRRFRLVNSEGNYINNFPEWTKQFEQTVIEDWFNWEKYKEETGIDITKCEWHGESYDENGSFMMLWPKEAGNYPCYEDFKTGEDSYNWEEYEAALAAHTIKVNLDKVPTYEKTIKILYYEEVGYQRKGLNDQFYEDYRNGKIGYFVWTLEELMRYKESYCESIEDKEHFQRSIIDNFIEGECCVTFDW